MKKFNKTIYFLFLGLISLQSIVIAMKKDIAEDFIEVMEEFDKLNLNDTHTIENNILEKNDIQEIDEQESSSVFDSQLISPLLPPQRSHSTPLELRQKIELKSKSQSEDQQRRPRRFKNVSQPLLKNLLFKLGKNDYQECKFIQDLNFFKEATILFLVGIKKGLYGKIQSGIKLCPKNMRSKLLSESLGEEHVNLTAGSLLIGLHGKNFNTCSDMLKLLITNDASELDGCTFLHAAAFFNCPQLIMYLLEEGFVTPLMLGGQNEKISAFHCALKYKCFDAAYALIKFYENKIEYCKKDKKIKNIGTIFNEIKKIKEMLNRVINQGDSFSRTPLHYLSDPLFDDCCPVELEYSQEEDKIEFVKDPRDFQENKLKMVKTLCKLGADVQVKDSDGLTPIDYAKNNNDKKLLKILEKYRPKQSVFSKFFNQK